jgi:hypothetical protein
MASKSSKFKWGIAVDIPVLHFGDSGLPQWANLKFNLLGIYNLRRHIGALASEPGVFTQYQ